MSTQDLNVVTDDIRVRRVVPADAPGLERFYAGLSPDSRASRFHGACRGISPGQAARFAAADHGCRDGFVALAGTSIVGHLVLESIGGGAEELAVAVDDRVQHGGVGALLVAAAIASARLRRIPTLVAWVQADNSAMRHLLTASHHPVHLTREGGVVRWELDVPADLASRPAAYGDPVSHIPSGRRSRTVATRCRQSKQPSTRVSRSSSVSS
jgi:GNAT superfamily N-acetyltransferase